MCDTTERGVETHVYEYGLEVVYLSIGADKGFESKNIFIRIHSFDEVCDE